MPRRSRSAAALASDSFISYGTWKWLEVHRATSGQKVYRYLFDRDIPIEAGRTQNGVAVDRQGHRRPPRRRDRIRVRASSTPIKLA